MSSLKNFDKELYDSIQKELGRQQDKLEMIASENIVSKNVLEAQGSILTNKYAEGYPSHRYYGGCEYVDIAEDLARDRAKQIFKCDYVNVQPHSGSCKYGYLFECFELGDKVLGMNLSHGGHLTHGSPANFSGKLFSMVSYGVDKESETIDYDALGEIATKENQK